MSIATWPNYHDPATFENFKAATGVAVEVNVFGSNEEMLAKLQAGASGWSLFVPTNYTISTYHKLGLIERTRSVEATELQRMPARTRASPRKAQIDGKTYAVPKNWGTTGFAVNTSKIKTPMKTWKDFFEVAQTEADHRAMVHDYQLTTIGSALVSLGFGFNSIKPDELAKAEELLIKVKPHLFAINSDYQPGMRATDAWMTMCWTNDGAQLNRDIPADRLYAGHGRRRDLDRLLRHPEGCAEQGGRLCAAQLPDGPAGRGEGAYRQRRADHRQPRHLAAAEGGRVEQRSSIRMKPTLTPLEFGAAVTLTDPGRAELMARFKSA